MCEKEQERESERRERARETERWRNNKKEGEIVYLRVFVFGFLDISQFTFYPKRPHILNS